MMKLNGENGFFSYKIYRFDSFLKVGAFLKKVFFKYLGWPTIDWQEKRFK